MLLLILTCRYESKAKCLSQKTMKLMKSLRSTDANYAYTHLYFIWTFKICTEGKFFYFKINKLNYKEFLKFAIQWRQNPFITLKKKTKQKKKKLIRNFQVSSPHPTKWFGWILWHINHFRLFNAKSYLYLYIKYMICKQIL